VPLDPDKATHEDERRRIYDPLDDPGRVAYGDRREDHVAAEAEAGCGGDGFVLERCDLLVMRGELSLHRLLSDGVFIGHEISPALRAVLKMVRTRRTGQGEALTSFSTRTGRTTFPVIHEEKLSSFAFQRRTRTNSPIWSTTRGIENGARGRQERGNTP
jgi:hypothetical protein